MRNTALIAAVLVFTPQAGLAQIAPPSGQRPAPAPAAARPCTACHGALGQGDPASGVPRIAGLSQYYIAKQLGSFTNGTRQNPAMEAIARSMSPQDVAVAAAYFARIDAPGIPGAVMAAPAGTAERGRLLATTGSDGHRIQACNNCHGPGGAGQPPAIPYLAGQGASYLVATLGAWKAGTRRNDAGDQMAVIAKALTPEDIVAVARHYSSLSPPQPGSAVVQLAATPGQRGVPARGRAILASGIHGCAACHTIPGVRGANGVVGPPLGGLAQRGFIAGQLSNRPDVLVAFLQDPPALVPRTGMPDTGLTREEALHVAAYLYTLEK